MIIMYFIYIKQYIFPIPAYGVGGWSMDDALMLFMSSEVLTQILTKVLKWISHKYF